MTMKKCTQISVLSSDMGFNTDAPPTEVVKSEPTENANRMVMNGTQRSMHTVAARSVRWLLWPRETFKRVNMASTIVIVKMLMKMKVPARMNLISRDWFCAAE